jgi:hypothetical protein
MLAEDSDIASYRLFPSERAYDAVWEADACALCGAPELDRAASEHATFEWLGRHDAAFVRGDFEAEASEGEPFPGRSGSAAPKSWEDMRSRAANDSRLAAAYPWQHESTEAVLDGVIDSELERIAVDELLFPVCGRCFAVDEPIAAIAHPRSA